MQVYLWIVSITRHNFLHINYCSVVNNLCILLWDFYFIVEFIIIVVSILMVKMNKNAI